MPVSPLPAARQPRRSRLAHLFLLFIWLLPLLSAVQPHAAVSAQSDTCEQVVLHYSRRAADYDGWGLHVWGPTDHPGVTWESPLTPSGQDEFGLYWQVDMAAGAEFLNYILHKGEEKDPGPDQTLLFAESGCEIWQVQGRDTQFSDPGKL